MEKNYRKTLIACYLAFITQAITANFAPLLFLKFHTDYGISLGQIASGRILRMKLPSSASTRISEPDSAETR